ncbi:MAG: alpha/beta hydrolase [Gammaproteobacteria bacterium]|jgi:epoxide hydrolase 4|nr:alpha/beta hydrolase [Gammaproteobacteria bacterium]MBT4494465.1 alpha/beta hydrolase [Gammaproteobacteria bacterium]MBT7369167.1 alpha/beta hydrolase [Gammaproteobacteria bacterium]
MISTSDINEDIQSELVSTNGIRLEVDKCGDQKSDKLAILLHGFPEHAVSWRFQMPMLAEMGFKVWAPNLRGYGNSAMPPLMGDYSLENLMADVGGLIDAAKCEEVTLIAHDWGAVVAWYFAIRKIRPLKRLIICNVPHPAAMQGGLTWQQLRKSWYIFFFQIPGLPEWATSRRRQGMGDLIRDTCAAPQNFSADIMRLYNENGRRPGGITAMINYYRALVRGGGGRRQRDLGTPIIETPTLMLWGEDDLALTKETTYGTENWVRDFTIRYLPRISHWVQQDAPNEVNAMIRAFIEGDDVPTMAWESKLEIDLDQ